MSTTADTTVPRGRPRKPIPDDEGDDSIREAIILRVEELGYDRRSKSDILNLVEQCGGSPGYDALLRYFTRKASLNTRYVSTICRVLRLELKAYE